MYTKLLGTKLDHLWKTAINTETGKHYSVAEITVYTDRLGAPVSIAYWYKMLKGTHKPSAEKVASLSKLFNVSTDYLLDDSIPVVSSKATKRVANIRTQASAMSRRELRLVINDLQFMLNAQASY